MISWIISADLITNTMANIGSIAAASDIERFDPATLVTMDAQSTYEYNGRTAVLQKSLYVNSWKMLELIAHYMQRKRVYLKRKVGDDSRELRNGKACSYD